MVRITHDPELTVRLDGEIDYANAGEFNKAIDEALMECPKGFVIDLSDVTYLDSAGIQSIFYAYQRVRAADGLLTIIVANENVRMLLDVVCLDRFPGIDLRYDLPAKV